MRKLQLSLAAALAVAVVGAFSLAAMSAQEKKPAQVNDKCPVSGKAVNPKCESVVEVGFC